MSIPGSGDGARIDSHTSDIRLATLSPFSLPGGGLTAQRRLRFATIMSLLVLASGFSLGGQKLPAYIPEPYVPDYALRSTRGYEYICMPSYEQPPSLMERAYFRENIDYESASLFVDDPWRGTVWEGYCLKKAALHSSRSHGGQFLEGLRGLLEFPQSLLGLAKRIFPQADVAPATSSLAVSDSVLERQTTSAGADLPIFAAPGLPPKNDPPVRPLAAPQGESSDASHPDLPGAARLMGVVEDAETVTTADTLDSAIGESPKRPESAPDIQPKSRSLQWLKDIFPKTKSPKAGPAARLPNSATKELPKHPRTIPDTQPTSPSLQLPRNTLPRTDSSEVDATIDPLKRRENVPDIQPKSPPLPLPRNTLPKKKLPELGEWLPNHRDDGIVIQEGTFLIRF